MIEILHDLINTLLPEFLGFWFLRSCSSYTISGNMVSVYLLRHIYIYVYMRALDLERLACAAEKSHKLVGRGIEYVNVLRENKRRHGMSLNPLHEWHCESSCQRQFIISAVYKALRKEIWLSAISDHGLNFLRPQMRGLCNFCKDSLDSQGDGVFSTDKSCSQEQAGLSGQYVQAATTHCSHNVGHLSRHPYYNLSHNIRTRITAI